MQRAYSCVIPHGSRVSQGGVQLQATADEESRNGAGVGLGGRGAARGRNGRGRGKRKAELSYTENEDSPNQSYFQVNGGEPMLTGRESLRTRSANSRIPVAI